MALNTSKCNYTPLRFIGLTLPTRPTLYVDQPFSSPWIYMNHLSLDTERVFIQRGEERIKRLLNQLGFKTIELDMRHAYRLGGGFHCWTVDIRRRGILDRYI